MIQLLPDHVINQIAAGEVIENPASVVKELLENALDAGATEITVEIDVGGRQKIRILDNGKGMARCDAEICLERHATSKLASIEDLIALHTMGFRGEALASIAAISKFTLVTCNGKEATLVRAQKGKRTISNAVRDLGTTIEVDELFYNVPVRKKFQRSPTYDANEVTKVVNSQALIHPEVKFTLMRDKEKIFIYAKASWEERLKQVFGRKWLDEMLVVDHRGIRGVIGKPHATRHNRTGQMLFVNGRAVYSPLVAKGVRQGYGTLLSDGRHPVFVLHINLPAEEVDVNVHPQKREVRFSHPGQVIEAVAQAVSGALKVVPKLESAPLRKDIPAPTYNFIPPPIEPFKEVKQEIFEWETPSHPTALYTFPGYILIDSKCLTVVHQRRAHARVLMEKWEKGNIHKQTLLSPIEVVPNDMEKWRENLQHLASLGFDVREFGPQSMCIEAIPSGCSVENPQELIESILVSPGDEAVKAAVSQKKRLSLFEANQLLKDLWECELRYCCPKGQPTVLEMQLEEIESWKAASNV